jgi:hypothetical protein
VNFIWPESARSELRAVDRENAMRILLALTRYDRVIGRRSTSRSDCLSIEAGTHQDLAEAAESAGVSRWLSGSYLDRHSYRAHLPPIGPTSTGRVD